MPVSRQRKTKAKKKPRGLYASSAPAAKPANKINWRVIAMALVAIMALGAVVYVLTHRSQQAQGPETVTASGLKYVDLVVGDGPSPEPGQTLSVHYTGTLVNGKQFDSSRDRGKPMQFVFRRDPMIKGWDEGISTMKVGGRRKLIVPPALGYGQAGKPDIPPNSTLIFDIELLDIK